MNDGAIRKLNTSVCGLVGVGGKKRKKDEERGKTKNEERG